MLTEIWLQSVISLCKYSQTWSLVHYKNMLFPPPKKKDNVIVVCCKGDGTLQASFQAFLF